MHLLSFMEFGPDAFIPFFIFSIPIVAIVGGITAGIVRTLGQQRIMELAQRERIAAIERGVDPSKLPPMPMGVGRNDDLTSMYLPPNEYARRRSQNLMIGGLVTLSVGIALVFFLRLVDTSEGAWGVGLIPAAVGFALLLSAFLVRPRNDAAPPQG